MELLKSSFLIFFFFFKVAIQHLLHAFGGEPPPKSVVLAGVMEKTHPDYEREIGLVFFFAILVRLFMLFVINIPPPK